MRIPLPERERLVDQVTGELTAGFPLAEEMVRSRLRKLLHDTETLHEFWRAKNGKSRRPGGVTGE